MMVDGHEEGGMEEEEDEIPDVEVVPGMIPDERAGVEMEEEEEEEEVVDMAELTFNQHKGSVFCVAVSKSEKFLITGGEDDFAYIYDITGSEAPYQKIEGHKDSVSHVGFSSTDKYYFTADLSGYIQLFETDTHRKIWDFEVGDVRWVIWHPIVPILLAGAEDGAVWMWKIPSFETKTIQLSSTAPVDAAFMSTNRHLVVGYEDGNLKVVDLKQGEATLSLDTRSVITAIGISPDDKLIMAGNAHSTISLVAVQSGKIISRLSEHPPGFSTAPQETPDDSVEHVAFHPSRALSAVSYVKDRVCIWDTALQRIRATLAHPDGVVKSVWAGDADNHLVTCCLDGVIRVWDVDQNVVVAEVTGHTAQLLDMRISQNLVVTAADDGVAKVFRIS